MLWKKRKAEPFSSSSSHRELSWTSELRGELMFPRSSKNQILSAVFSFVLGGVNVDI